MYKLEEAKQEFFEFTTPKGKKYGIPTIDSLPFRTWMRIREKLNDSDNVGEAGFDEIMGLFDQYCPEVMDEINLEQAKNLLMAYSASGSATPGE